MNLSPLLIGSAPNRAFAASVIVALSLSVLPSCSKEKLTDIANQVQTKGKDLVKESKKMTDSLVKEAEEALPETGNMTIQTPETIQIDQAVIKMHVIGDGRKNWPRKTRSSPLNRNATRRPQRNRIDGCSVTPNSRLKTLAENTPSPPPC